jgi:hypothetical protein
MDSLNLKSKNMNMKILFWCSLVIFGFTSCEPIQKIGPEICPSDNFSFGSDNIKIYKVNKNTVIELTESDKFLCLDSMGLNIKADLGESLYWRLTISNGTQFKEFSGNTSKIDLLWYGQTDVFDEENLSFSEGETKIELEIPCIDLISKNIEIKGKQTFKNVLPKFGFLARDWDKNGVYPIKKDKWYFKDGVQFFSLKNDPSFQVLDYFDETPSPAGGKYLQIEAARAEEPTWYFGDFGFRLKGLKDSLPTSNLDSLYVNVLVSRLDGMPNVPANFGFRDTVPYPNTGAYLINENINWDGWKLLSVKFSEFKHSKTDLPLNDIQQIREFMINFGASPNQALVTGLKYDMVLFTVGKPLFE